MRFFSYMLFLMCCLVVSKVLCLTLSGKLNVEEWNEIIEWNSKEPVFLFKSFRDGKHKILFRSKSTSGNSDI